MTGAAAERAEGDTGPRLDDLIEAERDIVARFDDVGLEVDFGALSVVSNIYRAASAIRRHMEQSVLGPEQLSWTAFVTLWVLWIWGEMEARHLAAEAGVTKGTLTGVLDTLERRGLVARRRHDDDRRLLSAGLTASGEELIRRLYPRFNAQEARIAALLSQDGRDAFASGLRELVRGLPLEDPS
ncbi:MarR family winged helix-turn-helix transcriptional regulator [Egicoccus halophilus]|uniref:Putative HTH-type transcriptional regulator YwaE n=1 Tax=Egicoccus halophilus TaxID=1670830 RepID=A0A8J3ESY9_9ACTN|nr:MarR family transcriptional regulator [Egicoccus halophilus]GGI08444.1 putative HTH-type transcriptional regulator YwaE [Egicoccus halophilus]